MRLSVAPVVVGIALLALTVVIPSESRAAEPADVMILFDMGDGTYFWSLVAIPDPLAPNASWDATLTGASMHNLRVEWTWTSPFGISVSDIGDRNPPSGFPGLYVWGPAGEWEFSNVGISDLVLRNGDAVAWYNAAFNPFDWSLPPRFPVPGPGWPSPSLGFRGTAANTGASLSEAPNFADVLWDRDIGVREIVSTPAVAYGAVYFTTFQGLYALDDSTGEALWRNPDVKGFSSPAVVDGTVVVGSSNGSVYRVDRRTGQTLWSTRLIAQTNFSGITSSPKVVFDWVYVGTLNESGGPGEVVALWLSNGTVAWRHGTASIHYSTPAYAEGALFVGVMGRYNTSTRITFDPPYGVLALDAATGTERWFFPTNGSVPASPVVVGSRVVVPSQDGNVYAIDRTSGVEVWRADVDAGVSSPAFDGSTIYVGGGAFGGAGTVTAISVSTGATRWTHSPNGPVQSSVTFADGKVFFSTNTASGEVYALDAETGDAVWYYSPVPANFILGSPVVSNGTLYAPSDNGHVYAFRDSPRTSLPSVGISAPDEFERGDEARVDITVNQSLGLMRNARLMVRLEGLVFAGGPGDESRNTTTYRYDMFPERFPTTYVAIFSVRASPDAGEFGRIFASFIFVDHDGASYETPVKEASLRIRTPTTPIPATDYTYVLLAVAAGVSILAAAVVLVWRQRRGHP